MTILLARGAGDPDRVQHAIRILRFSPLDEIADAVAAYAAAVGGAVYVEQGDDGYRWSPASRGGSYPLLRELARFLRCDHTELTVGFVTVEDWAIVADPAEPPSNQYAILGRAPTDPQEAADVIVSVLRVRHHGHGG